MVEVCLSARPRRIYWIEIGPRHSDQLRVLQLSLLDKRTISYSILIYASGQFNRPGKSSGERNYSKVAFPSDSGLVPEYSKPAWRKEALLSSSTPD